MAVVQPPSRAWSCPLLADGRYGEVVQVASQPATQLGDQVELPIAEPADGRVVAFALAVVFAPADVYGQGAPGSGCAISHVGVRPEVADL